MKSIIITTILAAIACLSFAQKVNVWKGGNIVQVVDVDSVVYLPSHPLPFVPTGIQEEHSYVDLNLPSGTLWATCNVGAELPEEYGKCFAWGETETKDAYNLSTYSGYYQAWDEHIGGGPDPDGFPVPEETIHHPAGYLDYGTDIGGTIYDAARVSWGGDWRLPSVEDFEELLSCAKWTITTKNGVSGYKITSKSNNNWIFLPTAGTYSEEGYIESDPFGFYWSSNVVTDNLGDKASILFWNKDYRRTYEIWRYYGLPIRPVLKP